MTPKPGHRTTEFLLTLATVVGLLAAALADQLTPRYAAIATAVSVGAYAIARGLAKIGTVPPSPPPPPPTP